MWKSAWTSSSKRNGVRKYDVNVGATAVGRSPYISTTIRMWFCHNHTNRSRHRIYCRIHHRRVGPSGCVRIKLISNQNRSFKAYWKGSIGTNIMNDFDRKIYALIQYCLRLTTKSRTGLMDQRHSVQDHHRKLNTNHSSLNAHVQSCVIAITLFRHITGRQMPVHFLQAFLQILRMPPFCRL